MKKFLCVILVYAGLCFAQDIRICVDSSANGYTLFGQIHESISYSPLLDTILIVNRGFVVSNYLDATMVPGNLSGQMPLPNLYQGELGPARYPTAIAGQNLYVSFPFLISGALGGMGAQLLSGNPVDVGNGDVDATKVIGKQLPNSNIVFIGVTTNNAIIGYTWDENLSQLIFAGTITTNAYYIGCDCNGGIFYVFYKSLSDSLFYYRTTIDGINWSSPQQWSIPLSSNLSIGYMQMALTDNGEPRIVFDAFSNTDSTYRIYVSYASGVAPALVASVRDTICFYPTIATGGNYCAVLFCRSRNMGWGPSTWWDFYMGWSTDNGVTWAQPVNCTQSLNYNPGVPQLAKRIDTLRMRAYYVYLAHMYNNDDPYWTLLYGTPTPCRIYLGARSYTGIEEATNLHPAFSNLQLAIYPNPFSDYSTIKFTIPHAQSEFSLRIYDVSGRSVKSFEPVQGIKNKMSSVVWDGTDDSGNPVTSGIYFVKLEVNGHNKTEKVLLLK
ncbi:MAG: T9SS type A sorting domain-containing protein [bacterium]